MVILGKLNRQGLNVMREPKSNGLVNERLHNKRRAIILGLLFGVSVCGGREGLGGNDVMLARLVGLGYVGRLGGRFDVLDKPFAEVFFEKSQDGDGLTAHTRVCATNKTDLMEVID